VERYDLGSNTWSQVASMNEARVLPGAVAIRSGRFIVVVGGGAGQLAAATFIARRSSEIYNVDTGRWQALEALLPRGRVSLVSALEDDGTVLAIGGAVTNGGPTPTDLVEALGPQNLGQ
jgi:N-acetylneuraminic acid mutarotase